jgi:DNA-binding MurR/RpiR family transcriptional regulator
MSSVTGTHMRQTTITCNSGSRFSRFYNIVFWYPHVANSHTDTRTSTRTHTHTHTHTQKERVRERERETDRQRQRQRQTDKQRDT